MSPPLLHSFTGLLVVFNQPQTTNSLTFTSRAGVDPAPVVPGTMSAGAAAGAAGNAQPALLTGLPLYGGAGPSLEELRAAPPVGWAPKYVVSVDFGNKNGGYCFYGIPEAFPGPKDARPTQSALADIVGQLRATGLNTLPREPLGNHQGKEAMLIAIEKDASFNARVPIVAGEDPIIRGTKRFIRVCGEAQLVLADQRMKNGSVLVLGASHLDVC